MPELFLGTSSPVLLAILLPIWVFETILSKLLKLLSTLVSRIPLLISHVVESFSSPMLHDHSAYLLLRDTIERELSVGWRLEMAAQQAVLRTYGRRNEGHVQLDMEGSSQSEIYHESEPSNVGTEEQDQSTDTERQQLSRMFNRLRSHMPESEEEENMCTVLFSIAPFLLLFVIRLIFENIFDYSRLILGYASFIWIDMKVQNLVDRTALQQRLVLATFCIFMTFLTSNTIFPLEDFSVIQVILFQPAGSSFHKFSFTLLCIFLTDNFVKHATCLLKLLLISVPNKLLSSHLKRRVLQLSEYLSQVARCCFPSAQWIYYFCGSGKDQLGYYDWFFILTYSALKMREIFYLSKILLDCALNLLKPNTYASYPSKEEIDNAGMCSICHQDQFVAPIKLLCDHIFCTSCIDRWLDKEKTCPMCRTTIEIKNNMWKNGATSKAIRFF